MKIFEHYRYGYGEDTRGKAPREFLGELTVKKEDAVGLDRLFEFYRLKTPGDSTTSDRIRIEYRRDGMSIGSEEFIDQSGVSTVAESFRDEGDEFLRQNSRGVDIELMKALAPLYRFNKYLWKKEANQPPQPVPLARHG